MEVIMRKRLFSVAVFTFLWLPVLSLAGDFNEHFLAAGCTGRNLNIVETPNGPAVESPTGRIGTMVLYCNVHADDTNFFNWIQLIAEDDTANGSITATLYQQDLAGGAPVVLHSVTTTDQAGIQLASKFVNGFSLNEYTYHYYVTITLKRTAVGGTLRAYTASIMDVLL
jgi:hypothetical protein